MEIFDVVNGLLQACADGVAVVVGVAAVESVEDHGFIGVFFFEIALHHGQLIQIRKQGEISLFHKYPPGDGSGRGCRKQAFWVLPDSGNQVVGCAGN